MYLGATIHVLHVSLKFCLLIGAIFPNKLSITHVNGEIIYMIIAIRCKPLHGHRSCSFLHSGMEKCTISPRTKLGPRLKRLSPSPFYLPCPLFVWCHRGSVERLWPLKRCGIVLAQKRNPVIPFINTQKLEAATVETLTIVSLWSWVPPFLQNSSAFPFRTDCSFMWRLPVRH